MPMPTQAAEWQIKTWSGLAFLLHKQYWATLNLVVDNQGSALKPSHLEAALRKIWRQGGGNKGISVGACNSIKKTEIVTNAFTGVCHVGNQKGHRATHFPSKGQQGKNKPAASGVNSRKGKRFKGNCNHCDKQGHHKADCWELPENATKKPAGNTGRAEQANIHINLAASG